MNLLQIQHVVIDIETRSVPPVDAPASTSTSTSGSGGEGRTESTDNNKEKEKIMMADNKRRHSSCQKAQKPPRPPARALSLPLDAADHKLISDLALLKRARANRMKALKKMRAPKARPSSPNTNLYATIVTILFCLVMLFQGLVSKGSSQVNFSRSPESAVANIGVEHVEYYNSLSNRSRDGMGPLSP